MMGSEMRATWTIYTTDTHGNMLIVASDIFSQTSAERITNNIREIYHDENVRWERD